MDYRTQLIELLRRWGYYVNQQRFELGAVNSVFQSDAFELGGRVDQSKLNESLGLTHEDHANIPELDRLTDIINSLPAPDKYLIYRAFAEQCNQPIHTLTTVLNKLIAKITKP